jgi:multimeric flavodoxin WrbA
MKNVLIISSSPRYDGNSDRLATAFRNGALAAGHNVEKIWLGNKKIGFCRACYLCHHGPCPQQDVAASIVEKMLKADVIVLATPVYFYTMSAQLKTLIDRSVMVYPNIKNKTFYYLMTMADDDETMFKGTIEALRGFVACCEGSTEAGMLCVKSVYEHGAINATGALEQAQNLGANL